MTAIDISIKYRKKLLTALVNMTESADENNSEHELIISLLDTVKELRSLLSDSRSQIEENKFNQFRQKLLKKLDPINKVSKASQQLWLILSTFAKIKPINDQDIFDLETSSLGETNQPRKDWVYTSSGHAFPLAQIVKCQDNGKFFNPCLGAKVTFNLHDQKIIEKKAKDAKLDLKSPEENFSQFMARIHRQFLVRQMLITEDLFRLGPDIARTFLADFKKRSYLSGIDAFGYYLFSEEFGYKWILFNSLPILAFFSGASPINSGVTCAMGLVTISSFTFLKTNVLRKFFTLVDSAFFSLAYLNFTLCHAYLYFAKKTSADHAASIAINLLPINYSIPSRLIGEALLIFRRFFSNRSMLFYFSRFTISFLNHFFRLLPAKIEEEIDQLCGNYSRGEEARALINRVYSLVCDMNASIREGVTPDIQSYVRSAVMGGVERRTTFFASLFQSFTRSSEQGSFGQNFFNFSG